MRKGRTNFYNDDAKEMYIKEIEWGKRIGAILSYCGGSLQGEVRRCKAMGKYKYASKKQKI